MGLQLTLPNILYLFGIIAPFMLGFMIFMAGIFGQNLKGLIYICGALLASALNIPIQNMLASPMASDAPPICSLISFGSASAYNSPSTSTMFVAFTATYLLLPMQFNKQMNYPLVVTLIAMLVMDMFTKVKSKCTSWAGAFLGALVGFVFGSMWYTAFKSAGLTSLLFFNELASNNVVCSRPAKQTFKCEVFKNGELVSNADI